jgi:hypothetical protein
MKDVYFLEYKRDQYVNAYFISDLQIGEDYVSFITHDYSNRRFVSLEYMEQFLNHLRRLNTSLHFVDRK